MEIFLSIFGLLVGLVLLIKGADEMVKSAIQIALKFKLPNSVIGAVFIGFGTSAPELFASVGASIKGDLDLAIGNIVGSNIANSLLVVSTIYFFLPKSFSKKIKLNQVSPIWMAILTTIFVSTYYLNESFPFLLGLTLIFLILFVIYKMVGLDSVDEEEFVEENKKYLFFRSSFSLMGTILGSQLVVNNAVEIATTFGVSSLIVGSTIVAVGTSLPEVASSISASKREKIDLVFGNIFGSNLFNIGLVGGASIVASPGNLKYDIGYQLLLMYVVSFLVIFLSKTNIKKTYWIGFLLLMFYIIFLVSLF